MPIKPGGNLVGANSDRGKGFIKSPNPGLVKQSSKKGGPAPSLKALVLKATNNGKTIVELMTQIAAGKLAIPRTVQSSSGVLNTFDIYPDHRDRMAAAEWLADRGFGRPAQEVSMTAGEGTTLAGMIIKVSQDDLPKLKDATPRAAEQPVIET